jgi:hypothetical protein
MPRSGYPPGCASETARVTRFPRAERLPAGPRPYSAVSMNHGSNTFRGDIGQG